MFEILRLLISLVRLSAAQASRRIAVAAGLWALASVFVLIGVTGFSAAFWIWLARRLDPMSAASIIGGAGFLVAGIIMLIARSKRRTPGLISAPETAELRAAFTSNQSKFEVWAPLIGLAILGFLAGSKPKD